MGGGVRFLTAKEHERGQPINLSVRGGGGGGENLREDKVVGFKGSIWRNAKSIMKRGFSGKERAEFQSAVTLGRGKEIQ